MLNELLGTNACEHGQLARSCEICEKDSEIEQLRKALDELRNVVIDHNRSGTDWKTPELFGRMMDALMKADVLIGPNAEVTSRPSSGD